MNRPVRPRAGAFPGGAGEWQSYFLRQVPEFVWPLGAPIPRDMFTDLREQFPFEWLARVYPGVTYARYRQLLSLSVTSINHRLQIYELAQRRSRTAFRRHAAELPFQTVDDTMFLEATQRGRTPRLTRRRVAQIQQQFIREAPIRLPVQSRYTESWMYTVNVCNLELRAILRAIYDMMSNHVRPGHRYRIRMSTNLREHIVRRVGQQTNVYDGPGDFLAPNGFEHFFDTFGNMYVNLCCHSINIQVYFK